MDEHVLNQLPPELAAELREDQEETRRKLSLIQADPKLKTELDTAANRVLDQMPRKVRDVIILRCADRKSYDEIAEHLGITRQEVEKRLSRGYQILAARKPFEKLLTQIV